MRKEARANVPLLRQRTQFTCMATAMCTCLQALGHKVNEDEVNHVMGATPLKGAAWEQVLATAQHYGCRATLTCPSTVPQLKEWTDKEKPVMIAWNPEGRDWSHASCVFDVTEGLPVAIPPTAIIMGEGPGLYVWVADSNIPHPEKLVRVVHEDVFYSKWYEKWPKYLVRRPACCIDREITPGGRQVRASSKTPLLASSLKMAEPYDCYKDGLRGRDLAECYMRFPDDLSPEEITFVRGYFPNFSGGYRAPRKPRTEVRDLGKRIRRLILVLETSRDTKSKKFLREKINSTALTAGQLRWVESLEKKYRRKLSDMPDEPPLRVTWSGVVVDESKLSASERAGIEKHFDLTPDKGGFTVAPKTRKAPPSPAAPKERVQFDRAQTQAMIAILDTLISKTGMGMLKGFRADLEKGRGLTEAQLKAVRHQLYKNRMRSEADSFRLASLSQSEILAERYAALNEIGDTALWAGRRRPTPDEVKRVQETKWQDWDPKPLPEGLYRYFKRGVPGSIEVRLRDLSPIRARPKGVANANRFMWLAYWGVMPVRKPLSLRDNLDGTYTVLDGNSTFANAKASGWDTLVGIVEDK